MIRTTDLDGAAWYMHHNMQATSLSFHAPWMCSEFTWILQVTAKPASRPSSHNVVVDFA